MQLPPEASKHAGHWGIRGINLCHLLFIVPTMLFSQKDFCVHLLGIVVTFSFVSLAGVENVQSIILWNFAENKVVESVQAHGCHVSDLDGCLATGLLASASHDGCVKVWR